jgi:dynein heavy chain
MLGDFKFRESLKEYDKDNIPPAAMKKIRDKFITNPEFDPIAIKNVCSAFEGLIKWVRALDVYDRVIKIVGPKKMRLAEAEAELQRQLDRLREKRAQLQEILDKLQALKDEYERMIKQKRDLEHQIELWEQKLPRAKKLVAGLDGEKSRWIEGAADLADQLYNTVGNVLICAGVVAYLGPYTAEFRHVLNLIIFKGSSVSIIIKIIINNSRNLPTNGKNLAYNIKSLVRLHSQ